MVPEYALALAAAGMLLAVPSVSLMLADGLICKSPHNSIGWPHTSAEAAVRHASLLPARAQRREAIAGGETRADLKTRALHAIARRAIPARGAAE